MTSNNAAEAATTNVVTRRESRTISGEKSCEGRRAFCFFDVDSGALFGVRGKVAVPIDRNIVRKYPTGPFSLERNCASEKTPWWVVHMVGCFSSESLHDERATNPFFCLEPSGIPSTENGLHERGGASCLLAASHNVRIVDLFPLCFELWRRPLPRWVL